MGVSLKTEQRRSHTAVACSGPWVRRAEGCRETRQIKPPGQVPVNPWSPSAPPEAGKPRRPPSLPLVCELLPDPSSFSVLRETPMAFSCDNFKRLKCYVNTIMRPFITSWAVGFMGHPLQIRPSVGLRVVLRSAILLFSPRAQTEPPAPASSNFTPQPAFFACRISPSQGSGHPV